MRKFPEYHDTKPSILIKHYLDTVTDGVFEIRIPKTKYGAISGYFDDTAIAAATISKENGKYQAFYVTANPIDPSLLARNHNKFEYGSHTTTTDAEVTRRRWFLIDLDPVRPVGISSTDEELEYAQVRAREIKDWLTSIGWPEPMVVNSGNGVHVMYRTDEPNDEEARADWECATKMLASIWNDDRIQVDASVWNASRIWKIGGTIVAKGSDTPERPHRVAAIISKPKQFSIVSRGLISQLADALKNAKADEFKDMTGEFIADMFKWLFDRGLSVTSGPRPMFGSEGKKWTLARCPFNTNHVGPVVGLVNNRPVYRCLHNSCSAFRWKEFREKVDPSYKDPDTVFVRLKEWCDGGSETADEELIQTACQTGRKLDGILKRLRKESSRARVNKLEEMLRVKRREFITETLGENNEKGNIVGLINRTRKMQAEGIVPMYWLAEHDMRIRVGTVGDVNSEKSNAEHEIQLLVKFHSLGDAWVKQTHTSQIITFLAQENRVNPLRLHFKEYRWDGTKRLDTWLIDFLGTKDSEYTRAIGRKWLISAAARALDPGCQADHMLIIEGAQGIGKSSALRILGGQFYAEYSKGMGMGHKGHQELVHVILGRSIVEMSELATLKKADMESLKAVLTTPVDDVRLSYERDARSYPRTCVFGGTTNEVGQSYIADVTGARRFWPCLAGEVRSVNLEGLKECRDQLWAEAVEAYEDGEDWWTIPKDEALMEQADRQVSVSSADPWYFAVRSALTSPDSYANGVFTSHDEYVNGQPTGRFTLRAGPTHLMLATVLKLDLERQSKLDALRLKDIYRELGFKKIRPRIGVDGSYAYEIRRESLEHLWPAITQAMLASKKEFTKESMER